MKRLILINFIICCFYFAGAQDADSAKILVQEGLALHDKGDYEGALKKYNEALKWNSNDFHAHYEKAFSFSALKAYDSCIAICKMLSERFSDHDNIRQVYTVWGSALDDNGQTEAALKVYDKGLKQFPKDYLLHFNKGLSHMRGKQYSHAADHFFAALQDNPLHPSSHYYLGVIFQASNRIASLLSFAVFTVCEPETERSAKAYEAIQEIINRNIKQDGNNITISISPDMLKDSKKKKIPNDFGSVEFMFSILNGADAKELKESDASEPARFDIKLQTLISSMEDGHQQNAGFYWKHFVPFFIALKEQSFTDVLSNIIYLSKNRDAQLWIAKNGASVDSFYEWIKERKW